MTINPSLPVYKSPAKLVRFLNPLLIANAVVIPLFMIALGVAMGLLFSSTNFTGRNPFSGLPPWLAIVAIVVYVVLILIVSGLSYGTAALQYLWVYRVRRNLVALGVPGLEFTPGWSIAWFFIPVMNFFRPWQIMKETVRASQRLAPATDPLAWKTATYPPLVHLWWWLPLGLSLGWTLIYLTVFTILIITTGPQAVAFEGYALAVLGPLLASQPILTYLLVRQITRLQEAKHTALTNPPLV